MLAGPLSACRALSMRVGLGLLQIFFFSSIFVAFLFVTPPAFESAAQSSNFINSLTFNYK